MANSTCPIPHIARSKCLVPITDHPAEPHSQSSCRRFLYKKKLIPRRLSFDDTRKKPYLYQSLSSPSSIRLVWLEPDVDYASLAVRIEHFSLEEHPGYFALSYCWGAAADTRPISCDDGRIEVTTNLQSALYSLRDRREGRWLWIDAICICQSDPEERAAQVQIMRLIYEHAQQTLAWLGEIDFATLPALILIGTLHNALVKHPEWNNKLNRQHLYSIGEKPEARNVYWRCLAHFYMRPWFKRAWVLQEYVVSENLVLICGSIICARDMFERVTAALSSGNVTLVPDLRTNAGFHTPSHLISLRDTYQKQKRKGIRIPLSYILCGWSQDILSTLTVDKVFALAGLSRDDEDIELRPDYMTDSRSVLIRCAKALFRKDDPLGVFCRLHLFYLAGVRPENPLGLPSWVPFETGDQVKPAEIVLPDKWKPRASSCARQVPTWFFFKEGSDILSVAGCVVDRIEELTMQSFKDMLASSIQSDTQEMWEAQCRSIAEKCITHPSCSEDFCGHSPVTGTTRRASKSSEGMSWTEIYARTLILNTAADGSLPDESIIEDYDSLREGWNHQRWKTSNPDKICKSDHKFTAGSHRFNDAIANARTDLRRMMRTHLRYLGWAPPLARAGDVICILFGASVPYLLRPIGDQFLLIGECFILEIMQGEALTWPGIEDRVFEIC